ncbi:hypothetical protein ANANG_G00302850 [Anguilla anguilla]|uniref:Uncharacterized protein n=1 Tax=Anguilla anguilla TaxID=7936 RepID=A0A9D3LJV2_ANGAN|nr:hypothetical protein ANANG_G00302850 [Anguilla anguilla]
MMLLNSAPGQRADPCDPDSPMDLSRPDSVLVSSDRNRTTTTAAPPCSAAPPTAAPPPCPPWRRGRSAPRPPGRQRGLPQRRGLGPGRGAHPPGPAAGPRHPAPASGPGKKARGARPSRRWTRS